MKLKLEWRPEFIPRGHDANVGASLFQLTHAALISHNIYCEARYTTADGSRIAFLRGVVERSPQELWVCDLATRRVAPVCDGVCGHPATPRYGDTFYFIREIEGDRRVLTRVDLASLEMDEIRDMQDCPLWRYPVGTVSPDERYYVSNTRVKDEVYGLYRVDLQRGGWEMFHEHPDVCNPHPQFEPAEGKSILVQLNRGCRLDGDGNILSLVGEEGATLYVMDADGSNVRYLPVGKPHTGPITGHECWVGKTGEIVLTLSGPSRSELHVVRPGEERSRCLVRGLAFSHVASSDDGEFFIVDDVATGRIYVGHVGSARVLPLCDSGTSSSGLQASHVHPYMTPDNRYVIFNSDRTGLPQLWAATVPDGFLDALRP